MLRSLRLFLEFFAVFAILVSFGLFFLMIIDHTQLPLVLPFENFLYQMAKPFIAYGSPELAYKAINTTKDLPQGWQQNYITASIVYMSLFFAGLSISIFLSKIDRKLTSISSSLSHWVKQSIKGNNRPSILGGISNVKQYQEFAGLLFFKVDSSNPNSPLKDVVLGGLAKKPEAKLLSEQEEAFCIQTPSTLYTVKVIQQLIESIKEHNASLKHPTEMIRFNGVLHSVENLKQLFDEDAYMKAVLDCTGKNQILVSPEARHMFLEQAQTAPVNGSSDLDMIYHGFYLEMGPTRTKTELYRLIKHL